MTVNALPTTSTNSDKPWLQAIGSRYFLDWLEQSRCSLAFSTYQTGKLFLVGRKSIRGEGEPLNSNDATLSIFERTFPHCMGMWASPDGKIIWLSSRYQIWRMQQVAATAVPHLPGQAVPDSESIADRLPQWSGKGYDYCYLPRVGYTTGHVDVHDMAVDSDGKLVFVCTMFGCLATLSETANFRPIWKPPFLSQLVPEDRCHLNGLAMRDGQPKYVTLVGRSDVADGWRDHRTHGGCVMEVPSGEIVCDGLSMPHSPRWYRNRLWVLNSGTGEFGYIDLDKGRFEPVVFCPGYLRGLSFCGDSAIVTLSKPRQVTFAGLELENRLASKTAEPQCGLQIIDLQRGIVQDWLRLDGTLVTELYDSVVLPGVRQPMAVGFKNNEIERLIVME